MTILTATLRGIEAHRVSVTAVRRPGVAALRIQGLSAAAEHESRVRVMASLANADHFVNDDALVTMDAGGAAIDGTAVDLAAALAVVACTKAPSLRISAYAELSLAGEVRPVRGVVSAVEALRGRADVVFVAQANAAEAGLVDGVRIVAVRHLIDALRFLRGDESAAALVSPRAAPAPPAPAFDLADVIGNAHARRALEIAAVGCHHTLLVGPPGAGKTMLARRLASLLPPLDEREAFEVTRVHSVAGLNVGGGLINQRPFRTPHHSTTPPGLVGGGAALPRPGEISLAHNGVLFLDELPEFARQSLEVLSEPLAASEVMLCRASGTLRFPASTLVIASTPPCPCGRFGGPRCSCSIDSRKRYLGRIPERLLAQFDLRVDVEHVDLANADAGEARERSTSIAARVVDARARLAHVKGDVPQRAMAALSCVTLPTRETLARSLRVARTIAALEGRPRIEQEHLAEALRLTRDL